MKKHEQMRNKLYTTLGMKIGDRSTKQLHGRLNNVIINRFSDQLWGPICGRVRNNLWYELRFNHEET